MVCWIQLKVKTYTTNKKFIIGNLNKNNLKIDWYSYFNERISRKKYNVEKVIANILIKYV